MSEEVDQQIPVAVPDRNQEQLLEEEKARLEELRVQAEERKKAEEEARIKAEKDLKKLQEALKTSLSGLAKTANNRSMAYNRLSLAEKQLQRLFPVLLRYQEIRYLDLSSNTISDLTVALGLGQLVTLNASKNQVSSLECFQNNKMQHLQVLNLSGNKIKTLTVLQLPSLRRLNLSQNQITEITWKGSNSIIILELRKNKLRKLKGIANMKSLQELYVAQNEMTDVRGIQNVPNLHKLSLRNNKIKTFLSPFPYMPALSYLNLRENQLGSLSQLKKIDAHIQVINFLANPLAEELGENAKKEVIFVLPHFVKVNKSEVTLQDRVAFEKEWQERLAQKEKESLQKEAADAQARRIQQQAKRAEQQAKRPEGQPKEGEQSNVAT